MTKELASSILDTCSSKIIVMNQKVPTSQLWFIAKHSDSNPLAVQLSHLWQAKQTHGCTFKDPLEAQLLSGVGLDNAAQILR